MVEFSHYGLRVYTSTEPPPTFVVLQTSYAPLHLPNPLAQPIRTMVVMRVVGSGVPLQQFAFSAAKVLSSALQISKSENSSRRLAFECD